MKTYILTLVLSLCALAPHLGAQQLYLGRGNTMVPALDNGDIVGVWPMSYDELRPGQIVAFRHGPDLVVSRLVRDTPSGWVTQSLVLKAQDADLMTSESYKGTVSLDPTHRSKVRPIWSDQKWYVLSPFVVKVEPLIPYSYSLPPVSNPDPVTHSVPDSGSIVYLLMLSISVLGVARRYRAFGA